MNAEALDALQKWSRKYYTWKVECGTGMQPGDGVFVVLTGGGRKVEVDEYDLQTEDKGEDYWPSVGEIILEAIRQWHADDGVKQYKLYFSVKEDSPEYRGEGKWQWWTTNHWPRLVQVQLSAKNEAEAVQKVRDGYPGCDLGVISSYEVAGVDLSWDS